MKLGDVDLNLLAVFEALHAERSVTKAALRLGVGQPAMSDALRRLRLLFGDVLFVRAQGSMQPTPKARAIWTDLAPLLTDLRARLGTQLAFEPGADVKAFTIASTDYTTLALLPRLMTALRRSAPNIDLRIVAYDKDLIGAMLDRGEVELVLGVFPTPPLNTVASPLFKERFVGIARRDHPALSGDGMSLRDFAAAPHALVSVRRDERGFIDERLAELGLRRRVALVVPYMLMLPRVLAESDLIAVLPGRAAAALADPAFSIFTLPFETSDWTVTMLWNPAARTDRATAWLRALIIEQAGSV